MDMHWRFRLSEPMASVRQVTLQEDIHSWSGQKGQVCYGYQMVEPVRAVLWGKKISLNLQVTPSGAPMDASPRQPMAGPPPKREKLSPERAALLDQLQAALTDLQESVPPPLADESVYWKYIDQEILVKDFPQMALAWNDPAVSLPDKFPLVTPFLVRAHGAVKALRLPEELLRDDTDFCTGLAKMLNYVQRIVEYSHIHNHTLPPQVYALEPLLKALIDRMMEGGQKLFGPRPQVDEYQNDKFVEKKITAQDSTRITTQQRLNMLQELVEDPCADTDDKIQLLQEAIQSIWQEIAPKPKKPPCPHKELIARHLEGIRLHLQRLEEEGEALWQRRMAEAMLDSANAWRESPETPPLSQEAFAAIIRLRSMHIESAEMEDGSISYAMQLQFDDAEDSLAGHYMYAKVVNATVQEITLMG